MALSAKSISLMARYDVVFEGQEKARKAFAISAQFWFYFWLLLHSLSWLQFRLTWTLTSFWQCTYCVIGELNFKFCLIAVYWMKTKFTDTTFAEDMTIAKWWLCIVNFPREKTIIPIVAVTWFYIQISHKLRPRHRNFFSLFRYQSSSVVHITDSCCYFKTWNFREIKNFFDIANRRMLSLQNERFVGESW